MALSLYLDFCASGGLTVDDDGEVSKMNMETFAHKIGWSRKTLYNWQDGDPDWENKVFERMSRVWGGAKRVNRVWRSVYVASLQSGPRAVDAAQMYLGHFSNWRPPKQSAEVEHSYNGFADIIKAAQKDGVIDVTDNGEGTYAVEGGSAPNPSPHQE